MSVLDRYATHLNSIREHGNKYGDEDGARACREEVEQLRISLAEAVQREAMFEEKRKLLLEAHAAAERKAEKWEGRARDESARIRGVLEYAENRDALLRSLWNALGRIANLAMPRATSVQTEIHKIAMAALHEVISDESNVPRRIADVEFPGVGGATCATCNGDGEVLLITGNAPCPDCATEKAVAVAITSDMIASALSRLNNAEGLLRGFATCDNAPLLLSHQNVVEAMRFLRATSPLAQGTKT